MTDCVSEFREELICDILPFWMDVMKDPDGGFYGRMTGSLVLEKDAPRGSILCARVLWTFSSAYRLTGDVRYLETAGHAMAYLRDRFVDKEYGGVYWCLDKDGRPVDDKKQFYAIAFSVYGLAEYFRACGDSGALELAVSLYRSIREHSLDVEKGGYLEAAARDWSPVEDMRLSEKDRNDAKTMNTHLHVLEAYTGLYRVWPDLVLGEDLRSLIELFLDRICGPDGHLRLFFDEDWAVQDRMLSYGHDIEASWLLCEAAEVLGNEELVARVHSAAKRIAKASMEGFSMDGGMIYEYDPADGRRDSDRHWWVQAETVVGCCNMARLTGERYWEDAWKAAWAFIRAGLIAPEGEWYWSLKADGTPDRANDRAGFWKCPYHNGRMCMEMMERLGGRTL